MRLLVAAAACLAAAAPSWARIHDLNIVNDGRQVFAIETFAYLKGGVFRAEVRNFKVRKGRRVHGRMAGPRAVSQRNCSGARRCFPDGAARLLPP